MTRSHFKTYDLSRQAARQCQGLHPKMLLSYAFLGSPPTLPPAFSIVGFEITHIIKLLLLIKIMHQIVYFIYLLQLKEYRIDRLNEHLHRVFPTPVFRYLKTSILAPISFTQLPKPTLKTLIYFLGSFTLLLLLWPLPFVIYIVVFLFSQLLVLKIHIILFPIEKSLRSIIYTKASQRIKTLKKNGLVVIGITGSYGKTTTKMFLTHMLSSTFKVIATEKSINTPLAISKIILTKLKPYHKFFIVEMGAYRKGEIKELSTIVQPDTGIITGISNQHLSLFGSQENIIQGKSELLIALPENADVYINKSSPYQPIIPDSKNLKISLYDIHSISDGFKKALTQLKMPPYLKINLIPAILIARKYAIDIQKIEDLLDTTVLSSTTMTSHKGLKGITIINDSYSANVEGVISALEYLARQKFTHKIIIMPCLIELGEESQKIHITIGKLLKKYSIQALITTKDYFSQIKEGSNNWDQITYCPSQKQILSYLEPLLSKETVVLIEGRVSQKIIDALQ